MKNEGYEAMTTNGSQGVMISEDWGFVTGMCPAMQTLESVVAEIAPTNIPVLFVGESGTGKAMFAQRLHRLSARCEEPVVTVSCARWIPHNFLPNCAWVPSAPGIQVWSRGQRDIR